MVIKYSAPTKFCYEPYGQVWKQLHDNEEYSLYVQVSESQEDPCWITMGQFLEKSFHDSLSDEKFIQNCLSVFKENQKDTPKV